MKDSTVFDRMISCLRCSSFKNKDIFSHSRNEIGWTIVNGVCDCVLTSSSRERNRKEFTSRMIINTSELDIKASLL